MPSRSAGRNSFDAAAARARCRGFRRRILEMSQTVPALHIGGAFSCLEMVDSIYHGLMRRDAGGGFADTFLLSKGHGCVAQYVVLDALRILPKGELEKYCTIHGRLGMHPDYGVPGIAAATGSLGHGLSMSIGMALAERHKGSGATNYVVLSDGELQEGSTWEAILMASSLRVSNLVVMVDNNDFQTVGRTSVTHPSFYPLVDKFRAFDWETVEMDGHDAEGIVRAVSERKGGKPFMLVGKTVKGKGVSFMENVVLWHYRSPNPDEFRRALAELAEGQA
jgi:transketolase